MKGVLHRLNTLVFIYPPGRHSYRIYSCRYIFLVYVFALYMLEISLYFYLLLVKFICIILFKFILFILKQYLTVIDIIYILYIGNKKGITMQKIIETQNLILQNSKNIFVYSTLFSEILGGFRYIFPQYFFLFSFLKIIIDTIKEITRFI